MRRLLAPLVLLIAVSAAAVAVAATPEDGGEARFRAGQAIVRFEPGASEQARAAARAAVDGAVARRLRLARTELLRLPRGRSVEDAVRTLERRPDVEFAQPNYLNEPEAIPNDTRFGEQWGLHNTGQTGGTPDADIDAPEAWDVTTGSDSVVVGIMDTGLKVDHPDLAPNVFVNGAEASGAPGVDDDANGCIDDVNGCDLVTGTGNVSDDTVEHGSLVGSTAGARGANARGVSGVAQRVKLLGLQVSDAAGNLHDDAIIDAVAYARDMGADVVNMSFGHFGGSDDPAMRAAIRSAPGVLFVTSAGNFIPNTTTVNDNDSTAHWPSNFTVSEPNVIAVANSTDTDGLSTSSSFGATTVDLAAPGEDILGATPSGNVFFEDFDGVSAGTLPPGWTATGTWSTTAERAATAPNSLTDSPGGNYAPSSDTSAASPTFSVPSGSTCTAFHLRRRRTQFGADFFHVQAALNGGSFADIENPPRSGASDGEGFLSSSPTFATGAATAARVGFRLVSDADATVGDGVHVDNVDVTCLPHPDGYTANTGTSFSSPTVAGAAALLLARNAGLTPAQLKSTLRSTVDPAPALAGKVSTGGRMNVNAAVRSVEPPAPAAPPSTGNTGAATAQAMPNPAPPPPVDRVRPVVSRAALAPSTFRPLRSGAMLSATRRGATLRFRINERSRVRARVVRPALGRRSGRRCVAPTRRNRRARRCTRLLATGPAQTLRGTLVGAVTRRFSGRVRNRPLPPRAYRLEIVATDAAGNRSVARHASFRIARR